MDFLEKRMLQKKRHCDQETNYFQEGIVTLIMEFSPLPSMLLHQYNPKDFFKLTLYPTVH